MTVDSVWEKTDSAQETSKKSVVNLLNILFTIIIINNVFKGNKDFVPLNTFIPVVAIS